MVVCATARIDETDPEELGVSAPTVYRLITRRFLRSLDCLRHKRIPTPSVCAGQRVGKGRSLALYLF
jgi:hypothetical protein